MLNFALIMDPETGHVQEVSPTEYLANPREGGILWLDFAQPTHADLEWLAERYHFHPLALEDCLKSGQRPKLDRYEGYDFLDLYAARFVPSTGRVELAEIDMFVGPSFLITSHHEPVAEFAAIRDRWRQDPTARTLGAGYLLYLLLDTVVDDYFPVVDELENQLDLLDQALFERFDQRVIDRIFSLKRELILFRKVVAPTRDVCLLLMRHDGGLINPGTALYMQDVYDHLIRVADAIDTYRDLVSGSIEAYLSVVANRTNDTMKRLTSISTVLMSVTLIAGIYGMNFPHMPELHWKYGYEYAISLMIGIGLVLTFIFKVLRYF